MGNRIINCRNKTLDFIKDWKSTKGLDIIIDIYEEIRFSGRNTHSIRQKYLRILYNIKNSNNWSSILDEEDWLGLKAFLDQILELQYDGANYYIGSDSYRDLSLDEIHQILLEAKYLKEKEISGRDNSHVL